MKMNKKIGSLISLGFLLGGVATSIPLISTSCGENPKDRTDINTIITQLKLGYVPIKDPQIILNAIKDVNPKASNLTLNTDVSITSIDAGRAIVLGIGQYRGEVVVTFSSNPSIAPWYEIEEYFNYSGGVMYGFKDNKEAELKKLCAEKGYSGIEFSTEITSIWGDDSTGHGAFKNSQAFDYYSSIKYIFMSSVISIAPYAFEGCASLISVDLGSDISFIGERAFYGCVGLVNINLSSDVTLISIGERAFYGCVGFTEFTGGVLTIDDTTINSIGSSAFLGCANLNPNFIKRIRFTTDTNLHVVTDGTDEIPATYAYISPKNNFTLGTSRMSYTGSGCLLAGDISTLVLSSSIGYSVFDHCASLTSINLSGVSSIGDSAFSGCVNLVNINLSSNTALASIGPYAFQGCASLTSINIPNSVSSIGDHAFTDCANLIGSTSDDLDKIVHDDDNVYYINNGDVNFCLGAYDGLHTPGGGINLRPGTKVIAGRAFYDCTKLESITFPGSVSSIGSYAFSGCTNLVNIYSYSDITLTSIGSRAFYGCTKFAGFPWKAYTVTIDDTTTDSIGESAFYGCGNLDPNFIKRIQFTTGTKLHVVTDGNDIVATTYAYIAPISGFTLGDSAMFREGSGCLLAGSIPSTLLPNSISLYAFEGCASLTSINLSGVSFINDRAFPNCTQLQTIICPGLGFSLIDQVAFSGCAKLQSEIKIAAPIIDLEDPTKSTPSIGSSAFSGCATATTAGLQITFLGSIADYSLLNTIDNKSFSNLALKGTLTAGDENNETSKAAWEVFMNNHGATNFHFDTTNWTYANLPSPETFKTHI